MEKALLTSQLYWKAIPLKPGMYKIEVAIKDVNGDRVGTLVRSIRVPEFDDEKLASSSLILADIMEHVPAHSVGTGNFIIGDTKVRPRLDASNGKPASFKRDQRLNIWLQVYNLRQDKQSHKTDAAITYDIVNLQTNKSVLHADESSAIYGNTGDQITIEKSMPLANLQPGAYNLRVTVNDEVTKQTSILLPVFRSNRIEFARLSRTCRSATLAIDRVGCRTRQLRLHLYSGPQI